MVERVETPIRDRAERLRALDPRASIIVQAPAGSGKTELLIQRFLTLLAGVDQPESIVALTFTRKAAGEMRHRVISALESASGPEPQSDHERQTSALAARALARDEQQGWRLLEHPSRLRIQTIDSLCGSLVRGMPWVSRLGAPPRPQENVDHLYRKAARETLQLLDSGGAHADVLARLLAHLDNDVRAVEQLFGAMLARRDQWLRHVVPNAGSAEFGGVLASALTGIVTDELEELVTMFPDAIAAETLILARFAAANLGEEEADSPLIACLDLGSLPGSDWTSLGPWLGLAEMFLTKNGERRRQPDKRQGFPPTKQGKEAKRRFKAILLDDRLIAKLGALRSLPPLVLAERQGAHRSCVRARLSHRASARRRVSGHVAEPVRTARAPDRRMAGGRRKDPVSRWRPDAIDLRLSRGGSRALSEGQEGGHWKCPAGPPHAVGELSLKSRNRRVGQSRTWPGISRRGRHVHGRGDL
jgi:ATP-dependent helicase/nuclease subunit A